MPIVQLSLCVRQLPSGEVVQVNATDPAFRADVVAWTDMTGHRLVSFESGEWQTATIELTS